MKTYKTIEHLKKRCIKNNGVPINVWSDEGIRVNKKHFKVLEYGNMGYNFTGNCYITFQNKDEYITIEYNLMPNPQKPTSKNIFNFVLIRENF